MAARLGADAVLLLHLGFIVFVVAGGALVARHRKFARLHLPAVAWAVFVEATGRLCPLTLLEDWLRDDATRAGAAAGFIERTLLPILYPDGLMRGAQLALAALVVLVNLAFYLRVVACMRAQKNARSADEAAAH